MFMQLRELATGDTYQDGSVNLLCFTVTRGSRMPMQDCAGSILYSTEKAIEVALEGMQCLGGNGYINGQSLDLSFIRTATLTYDYPSSRSWVALRHVLPRA